MSEEIELGGIKVPAADLEATPESIKLVLKFLVEERKQILAKIEALEERINKNSKNSSIPPSKNGFGGLVSHKVTAKRKPLKLQSRRIKPERKLYEVAECVATHEFKPSNCSSCGYELTGEDSHPKRHQIVDLPVLKPLITEYRLHQLECEHCGDKTRASLPSFVSPAWVCCMVGEPDRTDSARCYGARLAAFVAMLSGESRQSHRQVKTFLSQVFGIELARGTINRMRQEISSAVAAATTEAMAFTQQQPVVNCDETGFSQQNKDGENPSLKKAWLSVTINTLTKGVYGHTQSESRHR
jgi:transposase